MELTTGTAASMLSQMDVKLIPLSADAALVGKLFHVIENDGTAAVAEEVTDGVVTGRCVRLTPDHQIGQKVRFVYFN